MLKDFGKAVVRTPIFSQKLLFDENGNTKNLENLTSEFLQNEVFLESIYWSSVQLYNSVIKLKNGEINDEKKQVRLSQTLQKYIIRSCTRPTPFGTFAGVSSIDLDSQTSQSKSVRYARIDLAILKRIIQAVEADVSMAPFLRYRLNNTLYVVANQFRFLEIDRNDPNKQQISSLEKTAVLKKTVKHFKDSEFSFKMFFEFFEQEFEQKELQLFFGELIESGFLTSELELSLTHNKGFEQLEHFLSRPEVCVHHASAKFIDLLKSINQYTEQLKVAPLGDMILKDLQNVRDQLRSIDIIVDEQQIFHIDLHLKHLSENNLNCSDLKKIQRAFPALELIVSKNKHLNSEIELFRNLFLEKYDTQSVPLAEALDADVGIGFPGKKNFGHNSNEFSADFENPSQRKNDNFSEFLWNKIEESPQATEIIIKPEDLDNYELPDLSQTSCSYLIAKKLDNGQLYLENLAMSNPNAVLSRFRYLDKDIEEISNEISDHEKQWYATGVLADIIWIPDFKVGNVCGHTAAIDYDIPIFYTSIKEKEKQISISDILVSVSGEEVILFSKTLKRRILPRLSNAHNFQTSANSFYRFLSSLQLQNITDYAIKPNFALNKRRYYPRISYKDIILFPAHWILQESDIKDILDDVMSDEKVKSFLLKWRVARFVVISNGDNDLLIDTTNESYLKILMTELKKKKAVVLKEWLFNPPDNERVFTQQYIIPLLNDTQKRSLQYPIPQPRKEITKHYVPGSEWLYFKIYCGSAFSDEILKKIYNQLLKKLLNSQRIQQFFFIRFLDPHYHIRLRIKINSANNTAPGDVLDLFYKTLSKLSDTCLIWKITMDTYERELDRYGAENIECTEEIFFQDSLQFLKLLNKFDFEVFNDRFYFVICKVDKWLSHFKFSDTMKKKFCERMMMALAKENSKNFVEEIDKRYRKERKGVFEFVSQNRLRRDLQCNFLFHESLNLNLADYIHMCINRWFPADQRKWEYAVYYFCTKYYYQKIYDKKA